MAQAPGVEAKHHAVRDIHDRHLLLAVPERHPKDGKLLMSTRNTSSDIFYMPMVVPDSNTNSFYVPLYFLNITVIRAGGLSSQNASSGQWRWSSLGSRL